MKYSFDYDPPKQLHRWEFIEERGPWSEDKYEVRLTLPLGADAPEITIRQFGMGSVTIHGREMIEALEQAVSEAHERIQDLEQAE